jgi:hypothetical protein
MIAMEQEIQKSMTAPTFGAPDQLLVGVITGVRALHHPTFSGL